MKKFILLSFTSVLLLSNNILSQEIKAENIINPNNLSNDVNTRALLFETNVRISNGNYITTEFTTPPSNGNDINVYFDNKGKYPVTITFEKKVRNGWNRVGSFTVRPYDERFEKMNGEKLTTYRIKVDCESGGEINGNLRARQL